MLIEENRRTTLGFFDEGVSTPAKPKKAPEKEPVPVEETVEEEDTTTEEEEPVQGEPKSLMEEVGVEETVVREEPKNATAVVEEEEPVVVAESLEKKPVPSRRSGPLCPQLQNYKGRRSSRPTRALRSCWMQIVRY